MRSDNAAPIAVGGLGGSGTRAVAAVLQRAGVFIGGCLNEPLDNLWFTLLFRRPKTVTDFGFEHLKPYLELFHRRMQGQYRWDRAERNMLRRCATEFALNGYVRNDRVGFPWRVYRSFFADSATNNRARWGWKEPNAHVFLPLLAERYADLKYVHVLRHPLDLAFGTNHLQLRNWRHLFGITEPDERLAMLAYYRAANERALSYDQRLGGKNFLVLRHEDLCERPVETVDRLLDFCGLEVTVAIRTNLYAIPSLRDVTTDYKRHDYQTLQPLASDVAAQFGYAVV